MLKLLVISALLAVSFASDVLDFDDSNFASEIGTHDIALVEFFAPWCGHCKRLAPEYEQAATTLKDSDPPVALVKVDCTANTETCGKYGVSGYPTLKIFRNGEVAEDYNGPRENDGIVKYMKKKAGPASKELLTVEDFQKFVSKDDAAVVGFFTDENADISKQFRKTADAASEKYRFAHSFNADVLAEAGYSDDIVLFRPPVLSNKFEEKEVKFTDDATVYRLKEWIKKTVNGLCGVRTTGNAGDFDKPLVVAYYDIDYKRDPKGTNYWRNRVMKVGKKLQEAGRDVNFAVSSRSDFAQELDEFGAGSSSAEKPVVVGRGAKDEKFVMTEEFSMPALEQFVNDMLDGKLESYIKSEALPDNPDKGLQVAVGKNFDAIVNNPDKDVLIEFYAPWCGHCKSLEPKYKELADKLADEEGITIAKMDATANDVPSTYQVSGFPTLFFSKKGSKDSPKKYEGGREVDDFIKYIAKESTDPLTGYDRNGKKLKKKSEL